MLAALFIEGESKFYEDIVTRDHTENLLEHLGYKTQLVVVELNGVIINPKDWKVTKIKTEKVTERFVIQKNTHVIHIDSKKKNLLG